MPFDHDSNIGIPLGGVLQIIEVDANYQVRIVDDVISCDGTFTVTLPPSAIAAKEITISSTNGTITIAADVTLELPSSITTGASETFFLARGQWWHK